MDSHQLREALIVFIVLHWADCCNVERFVKRLYNDVVKPHKFKTSKIKNPCLDIYINEVETEDHYPHVTLHQTNVSDKSICPNILTQGWIISHIDINTFKGLVNISVVNLENNRISFLESEIFKDLKTLKELILTRNKICTLNNGTFKHLSALEELHLSHNCIKQLNKNSFLGLVSLKMLCLFGNMIQKLENEVFKHLISLEEVELENNAVVALKALCGQTLIHVDLSSNYLKTVNANSFADLKLLRQLKLLRNLLMKCTLSHIKSLEEVVLAQNNLTYINKVMFAGLINLKSLLLGFNKIEMIEHGAFKDLRTLNFLDLSSNKLTVISNGMFGGLVSLSSLHLDQNEIVLIEEHGFAEIVSRNRKTIINLLKTGITELSWTIFGNFTSKMSQSGVHTRANSVKLMIDSLIVKCKRNHCWLKHLEWKIFDDFYLMKNLFHEKRMCDKDLKSVCPSKAKWCMYLENNTCELQCEEVGKPGGELVIDGDVCPFQHYCKCSCSSCDQKCAFKGKIHVKNDTDKYGCDICNCQCDNNPNCWQKCKGDNFHLKNGTSGCLECKCKCPLVNCDAKCNGNRMSIIKQDKAGCQVCSACKIKASKGESKTLTYVLISLVVTITVAFLFPICGICLFRRSAKGKKTQETEEKIFTLLDVFTKNLDPELAQQVKESWFDPNTLCIKQLLGNGQFGMIWSGTFQTSPGRKYPAIIKVAKAEFRDAWIVQTRWNSKHELKPHFEKRPVQIKVDNQVIADLLTEAMIMKKFDHCNVLKIFGVSVHEEKPCIILPLMFHGDLKKYLTTNKSNLSNQQLTAFALGVAKGMAHLADKSYVHCDLAARNCLLDINLVVKVSDFGLSKNIHDVDHYKVKHEGKPIPVRWMSIESLELKQFSLQSDVWSFGVVLWEIFSYGQVPYVNIDNTDVIKYLLGGYRLEKPVSCPENIFEIMQSCWNEDPSKRPGFDILVCVINDIADKEGDYTEVKDEPEATCMQRDTN